MPTQTTQPMIRSIRSDKLRDLTLEALEAGFDAYMSGGGHIRLVNPTNGRAVWISTTSNGAARAYQNTRAALRRAGLERKEETVPKGQRATPSQLQMIAEGRQANLSRDEIASRTGLSSRAVSRLSNGMRAMGPGDHPTNGNGNGNGHGHDHDNDVVTNVGPDQQDQAHELAREHARKVADQVAEREATVAATTDPLVATTPSGQTYIKGTMIGKQTPPEVIAKIAEMADAGANNNDIARATGLSTWTVSKYRVMHRNEPARPTVEVGSRLVAYAEPTVEQRIEQPMTAADVELAETYPLIRALIDRQRTFGELLELAERTGDDDVQLLILQKMELTGVLREAVDLWNATIGQQRNGTAAQPANT